ncbi:MAG: hypothetical protein ABIJ21_08270 [Nanoarchaeota archaeon]
MFITIREVFDIILMTALLGFIFNDTFGVKTRKKSIYGIEVRKRFNWDGFLFAAAVISPSVILHELAHKFVAILLGHQATFHAFYADTFTFILGAIAIVAKLFAWGFIFFIPGFVSMQSITTPGPAAIIAFAGPAIHLIFWIGATIVLKTTRTLSRKKYTAVVILQKVNLFLFILNMLPIPGIDGWSVYSNLYHLLF